MFQNGHSIAPSKWFWSKFCKYLSKQLENCLILPKNSPKIQLSTVERKNFQNFSNYLPISFKNETLFFRGDPVAIIPKYNVVKVVEIRERTYCKQLLVIGLSAIDNMNTKSFLLSFSRSIAEFFVCFDLNCSLCKREQPR